MLLMFLIEWKNLTYASVSKWVKVVDFLSKTTINLQVFYSKDTL